MNELLAEGCRRGLDRFGRTALREALHRALDAWRTAWREAWAAGGELDPPGEELWQVVEEVLAVTPRLALRRAINATGVVLHTGLGRAPWAPEALAAAIGAGRYTLLELDRESGARGRREAAVAALLRDITGAGDGLAVNNNAGAVLLAVSALARGHKVALARSEMVEIGGSYRMPEVVAAAGAGLVELGTTNRVHFQDYLRVLEDPEVTLVLKVHPANFRQLGFTGEVDLAALREPCRERGVPLVYDIGSGVLCGSALPGAREEPTVREALQEGADLVTFSGDKLLGGPQAGLVVGAAPLVARLRRDVLARCLRLDKTILAALEATLAIHALGEEAACRRLPALAMLAADEPGLRRRAEALAGRLAAAPGGGVELEVVAC